MSVKKITGLVGLIIISLSMVIAFSFVTMMIKLQEVEEEETRLIEINKSLNDAYIELIAWMDGMIDHVMDDWPFEGGLDYKKSVMERWLKNYKPLGKEDEKIIKTLASKNKDLFQSAIKIVNLDDPKLKKEIYLDEFRPIGNSLKPLVGGLSNIYRERLAYLREKRLDLQKKAGGFISIASLITIAGVGFAILAIFRWVIKPLQKISEDMIIVSQGDLRVKIDYKWNNEIGYIAQSFNKMIEALRNIVDRIFLASNKVVSTVNILKESSEKTTRGAKEQLSQTEQAATAAEEMSQTIAAIARNASEAANSSTEAITTANKGKEIVEGAVEAVNQVHNSTLELASEVERLNQSVLEIGEIVTVINNIADQTNLLALNAAIEAARAGEQGRGFAVVADEVRKLAESTMRATAEITQKIRVVQEESKRTKKSMEDASQVVITTTEFMKNVEGSLQSIVESVSKVREQVNQIAAAVDEQTAAADQVSTSMGKTSAISHEMQKMAMDVQQEVNNLIKITDELRSSVSEFRTDGSRSNPSSEETQEVYKIDTPSPSYQG